MRTQVAGSWFGLFVVLGLAAGPARLLAAEESAPAPIQPQATPTPPEGAPVQPPGPANVPVPVPVPVPTPAMAAPDTTVIIVTPPLPQPPPSFRIEGSDGSALRIGLLLQPAFRSINAEVGDDYSSDLFLRRARIILGGSLFGRFDYFFQADSLNLFLPSNQVAAGGTSTYLKRAGLSIQDAFGTWRIYRNMAKIDVGYMLPPLFHNAVQDATTLYAWDYFAYAFQQSGVFGSAGNPAGRDVGIQARGLLFDDHLEYRAGLFQGLRHPPTVTEPGSRNFFRFAARVQLNLLDAEEGFFYQGTYLGTRKILSIGGTVDLQSSYRMYGGDVFFEMPLAPLGFVTVQGNLVHWNGHSFIPELPKQTAIMAEAGYTFSVLYLGPIVRFEHLWLAGAHNDQTHYVAGVAYWPFGHSSNFKAFYSRIELQGARHGLNQFNVQWQLYFF